MAMFSAGPIKTGLMALTAITLLAVLAACGGGREATPTSDDRLQPLAIGTVPTVTWAPSTIAMSANPGARQDVPLTLTATKAMTNVTLTVPTTLKSVVSIAPTALGSLTAGQSKTVTVTVAPGASEVLRTLTGTITVRAGFASIAPAFPVSLSLVAPESINGIAVPPEPPKELNDLTLAGFDMNGNGVRDDVERKAAQNLGAFPPRYAKALAFARAEQVVLVTGTNTAIEIYTQLLQCDGLEETDTDPLTFALVNNDLRGERFRMILGGLVLKHREC